MARKFGSIESGAAAFYDDRGHLPNPIDLPMSLADSIQPEAISVIRGLGSVSQLHSTYQQPRPNTATAGSRFGIPKQRPNRHGPDATIPDDTGSDLDP